MSTLIDQNDPGMAGLQTASFHTVALTTGDTPISGIHAVVAEMTDDLPAYSVVGYNADKELVLADNDEVIAVGITTAKVLAAATDRRVQIYRTGMFNPAALNWGAGYATDEDKAHAFDEGAQGLFLKRVANQVS